jgi:hypothetical protein
MYHDKDNICELTSIYVEPQQGGGTGEACDESLCGSYKSK